MSNDRPVGYIGRWPPVCGQCGHRHAGEPCADHPWRDSCPYDAGAECDNRIDICAAPDCRADTRGTLNGSPPHACGQYGSWRHECLINWMATDPEDRGSYADYLAANPTGGNR